MIYTKYEIVDIALDVNRKLLSNKSYFDGVTVYILQDGSSGIIRNSFETETQYWYVIFSEHNLPVVLDKDEVDFIGKASNKNPLQKLDPAFMRKIEIEFAKESFKKRQSEIQRQLEIQLKKGKKCQRKKK